MKSLDQQIAIAEWCGWKKCKGDCFQGQFERKDEPGFVFDIHHIPDYLHDLNAMHEAVKKLNGQMRENMAVELYRLVIGSNNNIIRGVLYEEDLALVSEATASQRAESLLRTIGKWKDE
jgi:hypothetical protein